MCTLFSFLSLSSLLPPPSPIPSPFSTLISFLPPFLPLLFFFFPSLTHHSKMVRGRNLQLLLAMTKNNLSGVLLAFDCSKTFFIYSRFILHTKPGNQQEKTRVKKHCPILSRPQPPPPHRPTHPAPHPPRAASGGPGGPRPR